MPSKKLWFMDIKDKVPVDTGHCPPHRIPHKLPFGEKIVDEPCHFHQSKLRMIHHRLFCKFLQCPHYLNMMAQQQKHQKDQKG